VTFHLPSIICSLHIEVDLLSKRSCHFFCFNSITDLERTGGGGGGGGEKLIKIKIIIKIIYKKK